jgi:MFS family permease
MRRNLILVGLILVIAAPSAAQPTQPRTAPAPLVYPASIVAAAAPPAQNQSRRDSVANGAVAGAIIGGIAAAVFAAYLCNAIGEEGDPPCWRGVAAIGALGAGAGAAAGAAIDAMVSRNGPRVLIRVRF